eukprot:GHVQ01012945.1.p1 GENE.GHVQ01012945.1~~GHVQ01012945.1.p1  ORF type:complete len:352 (+),score=48.91 GHVQ01012945.1:822-1877(+)
MSQTKWIVDGQRKTGLSVEEAVGLPLEAAFGACGGSKFMAAGREDVDVRMLGRGRPFAVELYKCCRGPHTADVQTNSRDVRWGEQVGKGHMSLASCFSAARDGASNNGKHVAVEVLDCQIWCGSRAAMRHQLQRAAEEKTKTYEALVWTSVKLSPNDIAAFNGSWQNPPAHMPTSIHPATHTPTSTSSLPAGVPYNHSVPTISGTEGLHQEMNTPSPRQWKCPFTVEQKTPLRVLHRRTADIRLREIHNVTLRWQHPQYFVASICTQAGTYIKELIHGDLGRTNPCFKSLLAECLNLGDAVEVDILLLDVVDLQMDYTNKLRTSVLDEQQTCEDINHVKDPVGGSLSTVPA